MNPTASNSLPGPADVFRTTLGNGITILVRENHTNPSVVLQGYLLTGSLFDPDDQLGLADFTAAMLMRGTKARDFNSIYQLMENIGASLSFGANIHTTSFSGKCLTDDLDVLLGLLGEALTHPTFPVDHLEKLRAQILTGLAMRSQDTGEMAALTFDQLLYREHPYRRPENGYPDTINRIQQDDLIRYHSACFGPRGMVIVITGDVQLSRIVGQVETVLGNWTNTQQPHQTEIPPILPLESILRQNHVIEGKSQADIVMGCPAPLRRDPDYFAVSLGNSILGQFGMFGRIGEIVREKSGLAYYAYTSLNCGIGPGSWEVTAGVNPTNIEKTIDLVRKEIERFLHSPVTDEELANSQANFIGRLPLMFESNAGVAGGLLNLERYQLGLDYYQNYRASVSAVTPDMVLNSARKYLDANRIAIAVAGSI